MQEMTPGTCIEEPTLDASTNMHGTCKLEVDSGVASSLQ